jgi:hypothetical protein
MTEELLVTMMIPDHHHDNAPIDQRVLFQNNVENQSQ